MALCLLPALLLFGLDDNRALFLALHHGAVLLPAVVWRLFSMFGEWSLVIALLLLLARHRPERLPALLLATGSAIAAAIVLKAGFAWPRPPLLLPPGSVQLLDVLPGNGSFPSGHAIAAALLGSVLAQGRGRLAQGLLALGVLLVCLSRIAIGVHWPLDVLVGAAIGIGASQLAMLPLSWPLRHCRVLLRALALALLLFSGWKLSLPLPNEACVLFNALSLLLALYVLRAKENGAWAPLS